MPHPQEEAQAVLGALGEVVGTGLVEACREVVEAYDAGALRDDPPEFVRRLIAARAAFEAWDELTALSRDLIDEMARRN